jgi:SAM-dependent methyltransferase
LQTRAEVKLIDTLAGRLAPAGGDAPLVLSAGAGTSTVIEDRLVERGCRFASDRVDVIDATVARPYVRQVYRCSVEAMTPVPAAVYDVAFSNYLLEHVRDIEAAAAEMHRVLRPGGCFVASVPNPTAPEFVLARWTPLWFHRLLLARPVGEKHYSFRSIPHLRAIFERAGFRVRDVWHYSSTEDYLQRVPGLRTVARAYDCALMGLGAQRLMGNVCLVFEKPPTA